eukprot:jgi/Picsp_1/4647/NSC_02017-R1_---NA---
MILTTSPSYKLRRGHDHIRPLDFHKDWVFEKVEKADFLKYTLASVLLSLGNLNRLSKSLFGLIPENSLLDKCPYYRNSPRATCLSRHLRWAVDTRKRLNESIASSKGEGSGKGIEGHLLSRRVDEHVRVGQRLMKKKYARDSLTIPGMVAVYNVMLVWMMFNIEFRASSL